MFFKLKPTQEQELLAQPETGMGYQIVKVTLKNGKILRQHKVLNSSLLMLEEDENFSVKEIEKIELEDDSA